MTNAMLFRALQMVGTSGQPRCKKGREYVDKERRISSPITEAFAIHLKYHEAQSLQCVTSFTCNNCTLGVARTSAAEESFLK